MLPRSTCSTAESMFAPSVNGESQVATAKPGGMDFCLLFVITPCYAQAMQAMHPGCQTSCEEIVRVPCHFWPVPRVGTCS